MTADPHYEIIKVLKAENDGSSWKTINTKEWKESEMVITWVNINTFSC